MRVPSDGPAPCRVMFMGEAPGYYESQPQPGYPNGRNFVGKSGQELNTFMRLGGLSRENVRVANLVREQPPYVNGKQQPPSKEDIERDIPDLVEDLLATRPRWIGAIGRYSARFLTGLDLSMEEAHALAYPLGQRIRNLLDAAAEEQSGRVVARAVSGKAREREERGRSLHRSTEELPESLRWVDRCRVVPIYHPASALHNTELAPLVWWDLQQFGKYVLGRLQPLTAIDEHPSPSYDVFTDSGLRPDGSRTGADVRSLFTPDPKWVAIDTEGLLPPHGTPWGLSISNAPGMARVISVNDKRELAVLNTLLARSRCKIVLHNALHDVPILEAMGVHIDWSRVEDTMLMLFTLRLLAMGLKPTSRRLSGMLMRSYDEVIGPAERRLALDYIKEAIDARVCTTCEGTGKVLVPTKKGDRMKKNPERCTSLGCIDGGLWPEREGQLKWDWDDGTWKTTKGWEIGRYLRVLKQDIEKGVFDNVESDDDEDGNASAGAEGGERKPKTVRARWDSWDDDVREPVEELIGPMPEATLNDIPFAEAKDYSACDADATGRNYPRVLAMVREMGLYDAYQLDLSVIPAAAEMQRNGMKITRPGFERLSRRLRRENDVIITKLHRLAGRTINPASGDQVAGLLFGERRLEFNERDERELTASWSLQLQSEKQTKTNKRAATDDKVLNGLILKYADRPEVVETVQLILDYRTRHKLDSTYAVALPRMADENDRVHTRIKPTTAATFRWASASPNLQNIPIRAKGDTDLGRLVRQCFVEDEGYVLGSADFDQVELRVLAALSGDSDLVRAFRDGLDPHVLGASKVWRVPYDELYARYKAGDKQARDWRSSAKNVNFGIVFGITARGLKAQMDLRGEHWTIDECQDLIDTYLRTLFPGIGSFMIDAQDEARRHGYVRSEMGHVRYLPGVWSSIPSIRAEAERQAANFKIQCHAAELLKAAVRDLWNRGKRMLDAADTKLLMSVHDEVLFRTRNTRESKAATAAIVETYMTNPITLPHGVQVTAAVKYADNWGDLKEAKDWVDAA